MHAEQRSLLQARIHDYFPYFHVDVMALVFLFKPTVAAAISKSRRCYCCCVHVFSVALCHSMTEASTHEPLQWEFGPEQSGAVADGTVNAVGQDYIGVLVLGIFNAAIGRAQIPSRIQHRAAVGTAECRRPLLISCALCARFVRRTTDLYRVECLQENCWSSARDRHSRIEVGSALCFTVHK